MQRGVVRRLHRVAVAPRGDERARTWCRCATNGAAESALCLGPPGVTWVRTAWGVCSSHVCATRTCAMPGARDARRGNNSQGAGIGALGSACAADRDSDVAAILDQHHVKHVPARPTLQTHSVHEHARPAACRAKQKKREGRGVARCVVRLGAAWGVKGGAVVDTVYKCGLTAVWSVPVLATPNCCLVHGAGASRHSSGDLRSLAASDFSLRCKLNMHAHTCTRHVRMCACTIF